MFDLTFELKRIIFADPEVNPGDKARSSPKFEISHIEKESGEYEVTIKNLNSG